MNRRLYKSPARNVFTIPALLLASLSSLMLAGCGGGGGSLLNSGGGQNGGGSTMKLVSCSLGGSPCGTAANVVLQTQALTFTFSTTVNAASVSSETLQILEVDPGGGGGAEPLGVRTVSGNTVTFTPEVSFDSNGNVSYGFKPGKTYRITIPNAPDVAITSSSGQPNLTHVSTTIFIANQLADIVPGPPSAKLSVPLSLTNVAHDSAVEVTFDDIMNVATLVNKLQGTSQTLAVYVDLDGNPATKNDQILQTGTWDINFDSQKKETTVRFTHTEPFPSPGVGGLRAVLVVLNGLVIKDLGGNSVTGPVEFTFQTAPCANQIPFSISEEFTNNTNEDVDATGANMWNPAGGNAGLLVAGIGGGSGQHGDFVADTSFDVLSLGAFATDGTSIPANPTFNTPARIPFVTKAIDGLPALNQSTSVDTTVTDGVFQFSRLSIAAGVRVRFEGAQPARIFVRGNVNILGQLDVGGFAGSLSASTEDKIKFTGINTPCKAQSTGDPNANFAWNNTINGCGLFPQYPLGKPGGRGGPLGGSGGKGGDLPFNLKDYPAASFASFVSFNGGSGSGSVSFGGSPIASGGGGTPAVPVTLVSSTEVFGNTVPVTIGDEVTPPGNDAGNPTGGITFDNCTAIGCLNPNPNLSDGFVLHATGTTPSLFTVQMGSPAGGGASHLNAGTPGVWCQEAIVTATCGAGGANKKTVPAWSTVVVSPALTPPAKIDAVPFYPVSPQGLGGAAATGVEPGGFGSDGIGNFSMLRGGAGGGGGGVNIFGTAGSFGAGNPVWASTVFPLISVGCAGGGGGGALQAQAGRNFTVAAGGSINAKGGDGGDHLNHPACTSTPACGAVADFVTAGKLWGQSMSPGAGGGGGSVIVQATGILTIAAASVSVSGGIGGDGNPYPTAFNTKFVFPGIATNVALRLRGGDGGVGRWHYQTLNAQNADAGFDPPQAINKSSVFTGINISSADFSGAESDWLGFPPTTGSFVQLTGFDLTIKNTGGTQVLTQLDNITNDVLTNSFAAGGTLPVRVLFQGARADAFNNPDLTSRTPWTDKVSTLSAASPKFVRFVVVFSRAAAVANPNFIGVDKVEIKGTSENCQN
ncbi:MAG: hypothetical protein ACKVS6_14535 [Planctomycetota bacterium]